MESRKRKATDALGDEEIFQSAKRMKVTEDTSEFESFETLMANSKRKLSRIEQEKLHCSKLQSKEEQ